MQLSLSDITDAGLESQLTGCSALWNTLYHLYRCPVDGADQGARVVLLDEFDSWFAVVRSRARVYQPLDEEAVCQQLIELLQVDGRRCGRVVCNSSVLPADHVVYRGPKGFGLAPGGEAVEAA